jgi:hypothetical protein
VDGNRDSHLLVQRTVVEEKLRVSNGYEHGFRTVGPPVHGRIGAD